MYVCVCVCCSGGGDAPEEEAVMESECKVTYDASDVTIVRHKGRGDPSSSFYMRRRLRTQVTTFGRQGCEAKRRINDKNVLKRALRYRVP